MVRHLKGGHTTQHAHPTTGEQGWGTGTVGRGWNAHEEEGSLLKKGRQGSHVLVERKECSLKITSREIIYHCSLYHFFWQRWMARSQAGSLLACLLWDFCLLCVLSMYTHTYNTIISSNTHTYIQYSHGDQQLATSAWWTSAFDNELTSSENVIIGVTQLNTQNSSKVVNLSPEQLKYIFKPFS